MICFPVHKLTGLRMVGGGRLISYAASANQERISVNSDLVKNMSLLVMRKEVVKKS